ncbi:hypothetical protein F4815DRAFT_486858 [Daldinia loculata]|nr:hypothetical protein F4815DRAFT_486858 [Daldinia loculata]
MEPLLQGLKFIDCKTERVVDAQSGWEYVALSYVWGQKRQGKTSEHQTFPSTIKDSIQDLPKYAEDESRKTVILGDLDHAIYWTGWTTEVRFSVEGNGTHILKDEQSLDEEISKEHRNRPFFHAPW